MEEIPDKQTFLSDLFNINPDGDIDATYNRLVYRIENIPLTNGDKLTYEYVKESYRSFVKVWNYRYASKEKAGFLPKEAPKRDLFTFLGDGMYEQIWEIPKSNIDREKYLFPDVNRKDLYDAVKKFREKHKI